MVRQSRRHHLRPVRHHRVRAGSYGIQKQTMSASCGCPAALSAAAKKTYGTCRMRLILSAFCLATDYPSSFAIVITASSSSPVRVNLDLGGILTGKHHDAHDTLSHSPSYRSLQR